MSHSDWFPPDPKQEKFENRLMLGVVVVLAALFYYLRG